LPPKRNALPEGLVPSAQIPGIDLAYDWGDQSPLDLDKHQGEVLEIIDRLVSERGEAYLEQPLYYLTLSGGGADGALSAGILHGCPWQLHRKPII
jgi:hypothetical protein